MFDALSASAMGLLNLAPDWTAMHLDWTAVQAVATSILVLTSVGAIAYAGLQLRHERQYRAVENLEKQLSFFLSDKFVAVRRRLAESRLGRGGVNSWAGG